MKKILSFVLVILLMSFFSLSTFAGSLGVEQKAKDEPLDEAVLSSFDITSGIDKEYESTFDKSRTIAGVGEKDTIVVIKVFLSEDGEMTEVNSYELTIGVSGMFSQSISLELGENCIVITAAKDGRQTEKTVSINRKKLEIKLELEQGILLPGKKSAP